MADLRVSAERSETAILAWGIIVDAARLNQRLIEDMQHVAQSKGCACICAEGQNFVGPKELISPEAHEAFRQYVMCRWPIQVFALDPVTQDQNVADMFSRRRELQLAMAVGVSTGNISAGQAMRFTRRLELDMETIALNRTAIGFSHGSDTFGWRFYPRVQTPDTPGTLGAFAETALGGPSRDADLRDRQLEPGIRECVAVIIMPSFVPYVTFESRGSWFGLTNPKKRALTMHDAMKISRNYQEVRRDLRMAQESGCYRPGDVAHMSRVVDQLERRLPMQTAVVQVPYENTLGGFEMFSTGVTDLAPELHGWYGAPGIVVSTNPYTRCDSGVDFGTSAQCAQTCEATTLFLVGGRFSVHDTKVIAGGKCVPFSLVSREIMRVVIPQDANIVTHTLNDETTRNYVDVHVATPYGVTSHLLIPAQLQPAAVASVVQDEVKRQITALVEEQRGITVDPGAAALEMVAGCPDAATGMLSYSAVGGTRYPVMVTVNAPELAGKTVTISLAVRYKGVYASTLIPVASGVTLGSLGSERQETIDIPATTVAAVLQAVLPLASDFGDAEEIEFAGDFFIQLGDNEPPQRTNGSIPIRARLECRCCAPADMAVSPEAGGAEGSPGANGGATGRAAADLEREGVAPGPASPAPTGPAIQNPGGGTGVLPAPMSAAPGMSLPTGERDMALQPACDCTNATLSPWSIQWQSELVER